MNSSILNKTFFRELFENYEKNSKTYYKTYVYVISKKYSDGNIYFKVGYGSSNEKRIKEASTFLAPPINNKGFKIHLLIFYEQSPFKGEFAYQVESHLHKKLKLKYQRVEHISSGSFSEWFLVKNQTQFIKFIMTEINNINPAPHSIYEFKNNQNKAFKKNLTKKKKHSVNIEKELKIAFEDFKLKGLEKKRKRGNSILYRKKLIDQEFDLDKIRWKITDVYYSKTDTCFYVDYIPVKSTRNSEKMTQYSNIVEVFQWLGDKKIDQLGFRENFEYWLNIEKLRNEDFR